MSCPYCQTQCQVGWGYCHCGCGEQTTRSPARRLCSDVYVHKGDPLKYRQYHHARNHASRHPSAQVATIRQMQESYATGVCPYCGPQCTIEVGECHCGCAKKTNVPSSTDYARGIARGVPRKQLPGHNVPVLPDNVVREIRFLYATTPITQQELAARYNVSQVAISGFLRFEKRKDAGV